MEVDFSKLDFATATKVDEVLRGRYDEMLMRAVRRQQKIAALNHLQRPLAKNGFGERIVEVDPVFDAHWRQCYGHNYSADRDLLRFLIKRNPEIAVRSRGTKEIHVGYASGSESKRPVGFGREVLRYEARHHGKREAVPA